MGALAAIEIAMKRTSLALFVVMPVAFAVAQLPSLTDHVYMPPVEASDDAPATVEVRCEPEPELSISHPSLALMAADANGQLDWYQGSLIHTGFGLDLTRPDHSGHLGIWIRCDNRPDCVRMLPREIKRKLEMMRKNWTWHIQISPPGAPEVHLRVDLVGSAAALDRVCGDSSRAGELSN